MQEIILQDLSNLFAKLTQGRTLSFIGVSSWRNILKAIKKANDLNTFKYNVKKLTNLIFAMIIPGLLLTLLLLLLLILLHIVIMYYYN